MYYNTTNMRGDSLKDEWAKTNDQEEAVMQVFRRQMFPDQVLAPHEVLRHSGLNVPITSIRRAMTDLTKLGLLEKTGVMRTGEYGKPSYCWKMTTAGRFPRENKN